jgi:hypothetical protein
VSGIDGATTSHGARVRKLPGALALIACVVAAADARELRVFPIHHRPVHELAALIEPLLSADGSFTVQPKFNLITVQDDPEVLDKVAKLLAEWDVPPLSYRVRVRVLLGTTVPPTPGPPGPLISGIGADLSKVFHYTSYQDVETIQLTATEGTVVEALAGGRYHLHFVLRALPGDPNRVQFTQFEVARREQGATEAEAMRSLLRTTVSLQVGQTAIVAAARSEGASQGLILVLWAGRETTP